MEDVVEVWVVVGAQEAPQAARIPWSALSHAEDLAHPFRCVWPHSGLLDGACAAAESGGGCLALTGGGGGAPRAPRDTAT